MFNSLSTNYNETLTRIHKGLEEIDELREQKLRLAKDLLHEKRKNNDLKDAIEKLNKQRMEEQKDMAHQSDVGELVIEKIKL